MFSVVCTPNLPFLRLALPTAQLSKAPPSLAARGLRAAHQLALPFDKNQRQPFTMASEQNGSQYDQRVLEQYQILTKDIEEVIGEVEMKEILQREGKLKIYWGTATTGRPHLGYFVPIYKISDFLRGWFLTLVRVVFVLVNSSLLMRRSGL